MSSMSRSISRHIARKRGTFEAQKPLRDRSNVSIKSMLLQGLRGMSLMKKKSTTEKGDK